MTRSRPVDHGSFSSRVERFNAQVKDPRPAPKTSLALDLDGTLVGGPERISLLDGGTASYPRMLSAIAEAQRSIHLETYAFDASGVGARFVDALTRAAQRGVDVRLVVDGLGSARDGLALARTLRRAGCSVSVHNRLLSVLLFRFARNHRKILLVDERTAFIGGMNIGDENIRGAMGEGWADVTLEIHGLQCWRLGRMLRGERADRINSALALHLSGLGGGWRLRRRYLRAFARAQQHIHLAHGYFLPDPGIVRAIIAAARRGVEVHLLLAGRTDLLLAQVATRRLHRRLLAAGVYIHEWNESVLHAKVAVVDGETLLLGSFNLDPFSLANLEVLVEVSDAPVVAEADEWIKLRFARSRPVTTGDSESPLRRWLLDPLGALVARTAAALGGLVARSRASRVSPRSRRAEDRSSTHPRLPG